MTTNKKYPNIAGTPAVSLVLLKAGGHQTQRIPGRKGRFDFQYVPGVGHVRAYHSIEQFHQEELEIRSIPQSCAILTRIGPLDAHENARSALDRIIRDGSGHAPTKRRRLLDLRAVIDAEVARLESRGVGIELPPEAPSSPSAPMPAPHEQAMERRRAELRRMGEHNTRALVKELGLKVPLLNNYAGMIEAVVEHELGRVAETGERLCRRGAAERAIHLELDRKESTSPATFTETELLLMPFADLKALAATRGIPGTTRKSITEELTAR